MIIVCLILIGLILAVGGLLYLNEQKFRRKNPEKGGGQVVEPPRPTVSEDGTEVCCGQHEVCEKTSLVATVGPAVYYEDEELDAYVGREPESYTCEEEEIFRDILLSLIPEDVAGWARSLQQRGINLPVPVREELLMIVDEQRQKNS